ncbi:ParA family protein [Corynebacterium resistens]|uniref:ParA family protein n=1 Tax=Corynebacterium resistens TaxID=258224 RepID=UPI002356B929|nr:ParA family protein [Corynebacterium resistens]
MIAAAATRQGRTVEVLDTDPQGSASRWAEIATQRGDDLPFTVRYTTANELRQLPDDDSVFQIIDTPLGEAASIQAAIDTADLVVIPSGASPMDIDRVWPTFDTVSGHPTGVLLTGVLMHTKFYAEARQLLEDQGVATFYNAVPQREEIKAAYGTNPTRFHGYDDVYQEISEIEEL